MPCARPCFAVLTVPCTIALTVAAAASAPQLTRSVTDRSLLDAVRVTSPTGGTARAHAHSRATDLRTSPRRCSTPHAAVKLCHIICKVFCGRAAQAPGPLCEHRRARRAAGRTVRPVACIRIALESCACLHTLDVKHRIVILKLCSLDPHCGVHFTTCQRSRTRRSTRD